MNQFERLGRAVMDGWKFMNFRRGTETSRHAVYLSEPNSISWYGVKAFTPSDACDDLNDDAWIGSLLDAAGVPTYES